MAAGFGTRMRPLTETTPKPLIAVAGKSLLDHALDRLEAAGVAETVVNVHYLADQVETHVAARERPRISISDERAEILDTGGGPAQVLDALGPGPFLLMNADTFWVEDERSNIARLADAWDENRMDVLLLLAPRERAIGYAGRGDFEREADGRLTRRAPEGDAPFTYAGCAVLHPRLFEDAPEGAFSLNILFDRAIEEGRMFGLPLEGLWLHVGTPEAIGEAEAAIARFAAGDRGTAA